MKLAASNIFKDKKLAYPSSVPHKFITTHLCKLKPSAFSLDKMPHLFSLCAPVARADIKTKEANFNAKVPNIGEEKASLSPALQLFSALVCMSAVVIVNLSFVQFSLPVTKYDRHGYKPRKRAVVLTDKVCYS